MNVDAVEFRLRNHDERLKANHDSLALLRDASAGHDTKIEVTLTEIREIRDDIGEFRLEMRWVRRGLWVAAGTFTLFVVALATLIAQLAGG